MQKFIISMFVCLFIVSTAVRASENAVYINTPTVFCDSSMPCTPNERDWQLVSKKIMTTSATKIYLYWAGDGGDVDMMLTFLHSIQVAQSLGKTVTLILVGDAYSCHAMVACYVNNIENNDKYFLMFHAIARGNTPSSYPEDVRLEKDIFQLCITKGILTSEDIDKILKATEVYVYSNKKVYQFDTRYAR